MIPNLKLHQFISSPHKYRVFVKIHIYEVIRFNFVLFIKKFTIGFFSFSIQYLIESLDSVSVIRTVSNGKVWKLIKWYFEINKEI